MGYHRHFGKGCVYLRSILETARRRDGANPLYVWAAYSSQGVKKPLLKIGWRLFEVYTSTLTSHLAWHTQRKPFNCSAANDGYWPKGLVLLHLNFCPRCGSTDLLSLLICLAGADPCTSLTDGKRLSNSVYQTGWIGPQFHLCAERRRSR